MKAADFQRQQARAMLEDKDFAPEVVKLAKLLKIRWYHPYDSRRSPSGFPDYVFVGNRLMFRELKTETGRVSLTQQEWIDDLKLADQDVDVWRPRDLFSGRILKELQAIAPRRTVAPLAAPRL